MKSRLRWTRKVQRPAAVRQIAYRARRHVEARRPREALRRRLSDCRVAIRIR
ncbi:hypothetical protein ABZ297_29365 [Nonomuraea sp. NPDC005983]|uniref:hypothetical protein n=1 Tax=Nonomuraea sp. NPDC005983 TaxID=3155595 RepID=UPI0033AE4050